MSKKRILQTSTTSLHHAARQLTEMRKALRAAEANLAGLHRTLKVASPNKGRRWIKATRMKPSVLEKTALDSFGNFLSSGFSSGNFSLDRFQPSQQQMTSLWLEAARNAGRIR